MTARSDKTTLDRLAYEQRMADSFSDAADGALAEGERRRAIALYEHALNFQINAINLAVRLEGAIGESGLDRYKRAVIYAIKCGRHRKARRLLQHVLDTDPSPERCAEVEALAEQLR
jgi:hypothetical protein